jgi:hypothetical protein
MASWPGRLFGSPPDRVCGRGSGKGEDAVDRSTLEEPCWWLTPGRRRIDPRVESSSKKLIRPATVELASGVVDR